MYLEKEGGTKPLEAASTSLTRAGLSLCSVASISCLDFADIEHFLKVVPFLSFWVVR